MTIAEVDSVPVTEAPIRFEEYFREAQSSAKNDLQQIHAFARLTRFVLADSQFGDRLALSLPRRSRLRSVGQNPPLWEAADHVE
jgi:hypothetical protein